MLSIYAQQMGLILQGRFRKSQPKFLPSSPGTVGWEVHGTFLPISVAFWDPIWLPKLPSIFPRVFKNFQAFFHWFFVQ